MHPYPGKSVFCRQYAFRFSFTGCKITFRSLLCQRNTRQANELTLIRWTVRLSGRVHRFGHPQPVVFCFLMQIIQKQKSLINYSFTRLSSVSTEPRAFLLPFIGLSLAVRRGNEHSPTPERLSAGYAIAKRCPPIRRLHNRIELHLACLVLFYDLKVIVFSEKSNCRYWGAQV